MNSKEPYIVFRNAQGFIEAEVSSARLRPELFGWGVGVREEAYVINRVTELTRGNVREWWVIRAESADAAVAEGEVRAWRLEHPAEAAVRDVDTQLDDMKAAGAVQCSPFEKLPRGIRNGLQNEMNGRTRVHMPRTIGWAHKPA